MKTLLADVIVTIHFGYVAFVVLGFVAILIGAALGRSFVRNRRFRWTHLVCTLIPPIEALSGVLCPLTTWEADLRRSAGQSPEDISFIAKLVRGMFMVETSQETLTVCYVIFGVSVVAAMFLIRPRPRARTVSEGGEASSDDGTPL